MAAYITTTELKAQLTSQTMGAGDDALLLEICSRATRWFESETGRVFDASSNTSRSLDAIQDVDGPRLKLPWDLCSINSITNGAGGAAATSQYATEPRYGTPYHEIVLLPSSSIVWSYLTNPQNAITISGKWGYSETVPADVKGAVLVLGAAMYKARDVLVGVSSPVVTAEGSVIMPSTIPEITNDVACKYRRWS